MPRFIIPTCRDQKFRRLVAHLLWWPPTQCILVCNRDVYLWSNPVLPGDSFLPDPPNGGLKQKIIVDLKIKAEDHSWSEKVNQTVLLNAVPEPVYGTTVDPGYDWVDCHRCHHREHPLNQPTRCVHNNVRQHKVHFSDDKIERWLIHKPASPWVFFPDPVAWPCEKNHPSRDAWSTRGQAQYRQNHARIRVESAQADWHRLLPNSGWDRQTGLFDNIFVFSSHFETQPIRGIHFTQVSDHPLTCASIIRYLLSQI